MGGCRQIHFIATSVSADAWSILDEGEFVGGLGGGATVVSGEGSEHVSLRTGRLDQHAVAVHFLFTLVCALHERKALDSLVGSNNNE